MLTTPGRSASPAVEVPPSLVDGYGAEDEKPRTSLVTVRSDTNLTGKKRRTGGSPPSSTNLLSRPTFATSDSNTSEEKRHISFNHRVDQCIAVDYQEHDYPSSGDESEEEDHSAEESEGSDEAELLTMKSSPRAPGSQTSMSSRGSSPSASDHHTIAKLAPTRLKTSDVYPAPSPAVVDPSGFTSGKASASMSKTSSRAQCTYATEDDDQSNQKSGWDDDNGFDYFSGTSDKPGAQDDDDDEDEETDGTSSSSAGRPDSTGAVDAGRSDSSSSSAGTGVTSPSSSHPPALPRSILKKKTQPTYDTSADHSSSSSSGQGSDGQQQQQQHLPNGSAVSASYDSADDTPVDAGRGRPSQRLGSSASYERIQDAARRSGGSRSGSTSSASPSGSLDAPANVALASKGPNPSSTTGGPASPPSTERERRGSFRGRDSDGYQRSGAAAKLNVGSPPDSTTTNNHVGGVGAKAWSASSSSSSAASSSSSTMQYPSITDSDVESDGTTSRGETPVSHQGRYSSKSGSRGSGSNTGSSMSPAGSQRLSVDLENLPSNDPAVLQANADAQAAAGMDPGAGGSSSRGGSSSSSGGQGGPTPLNTPTLALARSRSRSWVEDDDDDDDSDSPSSHRRGTSSSSKNPTSPTVPRRSSATGALVAPSGADRQAGFRVPLADDYVEEDEGGIIGRAVEIVNTARDLFAAVWPTRSSR